jgi:hypothetical protein
LRSRFESVGTKKKPRATLGMVSPAAFFVEVGSELKAAVLKADSVEGG